MTDCNAVFIRLQATQSDERVFNRGTAWCNSIGIPAIRMNPLLTKAVRLDCTDDMTLINMLFETQCYIKCNVQRRLHDMAKQLHSVTTKETIKIPVPSFTAPLV